MQTLYAIYRMRRRCGWTVINSLRSAWERRGGK